MSATVAFCTGVGVGWLVAAIVAAVVLIWTADRHEHRWIPVQVSHHKHYGNFGEFRYTECVAQVVCRDCGESTGHQLALRRLTASSAAKILEYRYGFTAGVQGEDWEPDGVVTADSDGGSGRTGAA